MFGRHEPAIAILDEYPLRRLDSSSSYVSPSFKISSSLPEEEEESGLGDHEKPYGIDLKCRVAAAPAWFIGTTRVTTVTIIITRSHGHNESSNFSNSRTWLNTVGFGSNGD
ncbi:hypothetical protein FRC18_011360 [Serendipita sp. 400]|nr:hypothetical protein FRC18_011360 [Serendipita sp. 400]